MSPPINEDKFSNSRAHLKSLKLQALDEDLQAVFHGFDLEDVRSFQLDDLIRLQEMRIMRDLVNAVQDLKKEVKTRLL